MLFKSVKTPRLYLWTGESRALLSPPLLFPTFLTSRRTQLSERLKQATNIYEVSYGGFLKAKKLGLVVDII